MGTANCSNCVQCHKEKSELIHEYSITQKSREEVHSIPKEGKLEEITNKRVQAYEPFKDIVQPPQILISESAHLQATKIQALWKGSQVRKLLSESIPSSQSLIQSTPSQLLNVQQNNSAYFNQYEEQIQVNPTTPQIRVTKPLIKFEAGFTYVGEWKGSVKDGFGVQTWPNGARYVGEWKDNRANGMGAFCHPDSTVYTGQWVNDMAHGFGVYKQFNGGIYEGHWLHDQQNGEGNEKCNWYFQGPDNSSFKGEYKDGMKHGKGIYIWPNGSYYEGSWENNKQNGYGEFYSANGRSYKGQWKDNLMHGSGLYTWANGRQFQGIYVNDKEHGMGKYTLSNGGYYEGEWKEGKQDGLGSYTLPNGRVKHGIWVNGKLQKWISQSNKQ